MSDPYIQELFAERIGGNQYGKSTAIYKFEKIKRAKRAAKAAKPDVALIDMGVGEPDEMAFPIVIETLQAEAAKEENRGYADNGGDEFKAAAAKYMAEVFGVTDICAATEVVHSIGSKTALSMIPACFINPGDYVLMTVPGYPVLGTHAKYLGGEVYNMKLEEANNFLPDLDAVPTDVVAKAKIMVLNYPNNPTGASATLGFFEKAIAFAKANNLIILQDAAYASLIFEGSPVSIFQVPGAKDVAIELHSLSKSYNMTGWRIGFVVGNELIVKAYADMKDNSDSGQFLAIQKAGAVALANPQITDEIAAKYSRRMDLLVDALNKAGFKAKKPKGSFFLYVGAPKLAKIGEVTTEFANGEAFSQWLITNELISTVPWDDCGNFVRFSVTFAAKGVEAEKTIATEIGQRLAKYEFVF
ncbi:MAG: LL-diaminopimelate aminotransferase [Opitutales bacterium]|jgi:LL-diaminopimelate aminotransferase|nr:LL-diaminopimelate aminotransferase [Opitutales bacterium]MDP4643532.1 LL-diaminopimelate aminotransferase [Opitutales bacterium]MDP4778386.1 LL-diaminopimelate aminotransferase [Opitutales bacterium]MDP4884077.1 LL-diaminopimelate aminotransferase [Opitutales bacterium]MDP5080652.1 LL-diaminopimelate aminotransferase [Opitutales bacterium]